MKCHYCNREIAGEGADISSTDGSRTLYFCDKICGIACLDADLMHPDWFDKETRMACLERRKERDPEMFELIMRAANGKRSIYCDYGE